MKKFILFFVACIFLSLATFAQSDTVVVNPIIAEGIWGFVSNLLVKYQWITYVITGLFFLSEIIGNITKVKANSVYQLIASYLLYFKKKQVNK